MKHRDGGAPASNEGRDHHIGRHRRTVDVEPGFAAGGRIGDRMRSRPDLMALEQAPADRGESRGRYDQ